MPFQFYQKTFRNLSDLLYFLVHFWPFLIFFFHILFNIVIDDLFFINFFQKFLLYIIVFCILIYFVIELQVEILFNKFLLRIRGKYPSIKFFDKPKSMYIICETIFTEIFNN